MVDRLKPILLSTYEIAADAALRKMAERYGVRVCPKVRVADVLRIEESGLPKDEYSYALRAHFDFVIADGDNGFPDFAVEFDGYQHQTDPGTILRDYMKDAICQKLGLPILRIDARYLIPLNKWGTVLGWLVAIWYLQKGFRDAQERGEVPPGEDFSYNSLFEIQEDGRLEDFTIVSQAQNEFAAAAEQGITAVNYPEVVFNVNEVDGYWKAHAILSLKDSRYIIGEARCRLSGFQNIEPWDIARDLVLLDTAEKLKGFRRGEYQPNTPANLAVLRSNTVGWLREGLLLPQ